MFDFVFENKALLIEITHQYFKLMFPFVFLVLFVILFSCFINVFRNLEKYNWQNWMFFTNIPFSLKTKHLKYRSVVLFLTMPYFCILNFFLDNPPFNTTLSLFLAFVFFPYTFLAFGLVFLFEALIMFCVVLKREFTHP